MALTGQQRNNSPEPDLPGTEIKVTGLKKLKNGAFAVRDRLVLTNFNPSQIVQEEFETSHVYAKSKYIFVIFYSIEKERKDCKIECATLFDLTQNEHYQDIKNDFYINQKKVKEGQAHLISGTTTKYLTTCQKQTKMQKQPFSDKLVKMRAWAFSRRFVQQYIFMACDNVDEKGNIY